MTGNSTILHGFFRSSASWRVRIALALKGVEYRQVSYVLRTGEQRSDEYLAKNPQGLVPSLEIDGHCLTQSLAIIEYLDEVYPEPALLGASALERARIRAFSMAIACDVHPIQNLRVLKAVSSLAGEAASQDWARKTNEEGLTACERLIENEPGPFCFGDKPSLADICLVPQLGNARRFGAHMKWPRLLEAESHCMQLSAFADSVPEKQPDASA